MGAPSVDEMLKAMADNRMRLSRRLRGIRSSSSLSERDRAREIKNLWVEAMRRHYRYLDAYLRARQRERNGGMGGQSEVATRWLWAPARPPELRASIRPNLVTDLDEDMTMEIDADGGQDVAEPIDHALRADD